MLAEKKEPKRKTLIPISKLIIIVILKLFALLIGCDVCRLNGRKWFGKMMLWILKITQIVNNLSLLLLLLHSIYLLLLLRAFRSFGPLSVVFPWFSVINITNKRHNISHFWHFIHFRYLQLSNRSVFRRIPLLLEWNMCEMWYDDHFYGIRSLSLIRNQCTDRAFAQLKLMLHFREMPFSPKNQKQLLDQLPQKQRMKKRRFQLEWQHRFLPIEWTWTYKQIHWRSNEVANEAKKNNEMRVLISKCVTHQLVTERRTFASEKIFTRTTHKKKRPNDTWYGR